MVNNTVAKSTIGYIQWVQDLYLLPAAHSPMYTPAQDTSADLAVALLIHYSFDLGGYHASELIDMWQKQYPVNWLHIGVVEALYQGRYKAVSVQQILTMWHRRGQATYHFNMEFERLICSKFPESLTSAPPPALPPVKNRTREEKNYQVLSTASNQQGEFTSVEALPIPSLSTASSSRSSILTNSERSAIHHKLVKLLPQVISEKVQELSASSVNRPPIGQFTPEKSDRTESFTSKLKAIAQEDGE